MIPIGSSRGYNMRSGISLGRSTVEVTTWLWIGCTVATLVMSQQNFYTNGRYGKRSDPRQASSFWSGSRYGRSGDSALVGSSTRDEKIEAADVGKDVEVSPRMDRFFLGSRYGKRTFSNDQRTDYLKHFETSLDFLISFGHLQTTDKEQLKVLTRKLQNSENSNDVIPGVKNISSADGSIKSYGTFSENGFACLHTGVTNLYRCFHRRNNNEAQGSLK